MLSLTAWIVPAASLGIGSVYYAIFGGLLDGALLLAALLWQKRSHITAYVIRGTTEAQLPWMTLLIAAAAAILSTVVILILQKWTNTSRNSASWSGPGRHLFFPCSMTQARLFPRKHAFAYSYLVVGVPVDWEGVACSMISAGPQTRLGWKGWFHVEPGDHLERGGGHLGLRGKLDACLKPQGISPSQYPHAYLVTAAKFLGYGFSPVSFWYLYDADKTLAALVLEVNNTFGERRMYFMTLSQAQPVSPSASAMFTQTVAKDFHVSPFNSRKGSYVLTTSDPLAPDMQGAGPINVTIVLRSSHGHDKIVSRLFSAGRADASAVDPTKMSAWQRLRFLAAWWWAGFATFPRMAWEAGRLFFQRKLHVWLRPEPLETSMGRRAGPMERRLEAVFRQYLRHLVEGASAPLAVRYIPCGLLEASQELMLSPLAREKRETAAAAADEVVFRVLTPVFYTRFVGYAHDVEGLFCELRDSCTIAVSRPELLLTKLVLTQTPRPPLPVASIVDFAAFKAIQALRRRPRRIERPTTRPRRHGCASSPASVTSTGDLRGFRPSAMDGFVLMAGEGRSSVGSLRKTYWTTVLALFLADRTALGAAPLFAAQCLVVRAWVAWVVAGGLLRLVQR